MIQLSTIIAQAAASTDEARLSAIQGLNQKVETENAALRVENLELKRRLDKLERLMDHSNARR